MQTAKLKNFLEINPTVRLTKGLEYPFIPMDAIIPGQRYVKAPGSRVSGGGAKFCGGDTLFARITPCLENGKIAQFKASASQVAFGSTEYWVFRAREGISDPSYVFYLSTSRLIRDPAEKSMAGASGRQRAELAAIEDLEIPFPSLQKQIRIASILSAYDDLIENNNRRIIILEEMARRIYEEWFVNFRFPDHEMVKMVESDLGLIPEGWQITTLESVTKYINRGLPPKYDDQADGIVINQKCIRDQRLNYEQVRMQSKTVPNEKRIRYGDVLINSTGVGTLGRTTQVLDERPNCTADSHITIVRPGDQVTTHYFGMALLALEPYFEKQGIGATGQTELGRGRVAETAITLPAAALQEQFDRLVGPLRLMAINLAVKNVNLRATRDLLLPKLISGELDVPSPPEPEALVV